MTEEDKTLEDYPDRFADIHEDKTVFITGGSGFMGKVMVEKLLRRTEVRRIYLLLRTKKGKDPNERLEELYGNVLFDLVKKEKGAEILNKVRVISGDITAINLGISPEDRQTLIDEVDIIYHCAATVRFDEPLKKAVLINVRGTKFMLELAHELKHLLLFCHVSTAYCHLEESVLYEKPYDPPRDPHRIIEIVEWMDDDILEGITPKILGDIPNTYAFSKSLAEGLVNAELNRLPIILCRPSVIVPMWKEPLPGWSDNINGPMGFLVGAGKGVIRTMHIDSNIYADFVPVDIVCNAILAVSFNYLKFNSKRQVFNLTSSGEIKMSWEKVIEIGKDVIFNRVPLNNVVWYPGGTTKKNRFVHNLCALFFHVIPALFIDALLLCLGYRPVLLRIHKRIQKGFDIFDYYSQRQWEFNNEETLKDRSLLNPRERALYTLSSDGIDYHDYFEQCLLMLRRHILKEPDSTIPAAKRHMKLMYCVDKICKTLIVLGFFYLLYTKLFQPLFN